MIGMSVADSRLDASEISKQYNKLQIQYKYSPRNRRLDLRGLLTLKVQDNTANF